MLISFCLLVDNLFIKIKIKEALNLKFRLFYLKVSKNEKHKKCKKIDSSANKGVILKKS